MVEQVKAFLSMDQKKLSTQFEDFGSLKKKTLKQSMEQCAQEFDYPLDGNDTEHENFRHFAICLRNQVFLNPTLNQSRALRVNLLGIDY